MSILVSFIKGLALGFGAAIPLGPINLLIMNEALKSYKKAVAIGFGAMSADITYLLLISYGITTYLQKKIFIDTLSALGGTFLIYLAFLIFKTRNKHIDKLQITKNTTLLSNYLKGYILTLLNPYTVFFWLSVTTYSNINGSLSFTLLGMIFAILLWITIMPYLVYRKRSLISDKFSSIVALISSLIFLLFGFSLLFEIF
mgnify:CR=1 FL=1